MRNLSCTPRLAILLCAALFVAAVCESRAHAASDEAAEPQRSLTTAQWLADLDQLTTGLRQIHPDPFHHLSEDEFEMRVASLRTEIPHLSDRQITLRMAALVASVRDGHTRLTLPVKGTVIGPAMGHSADPNPKIDVTLHGLPMVFDLFDDGLFVVQATEPYRHLIGARVESIGELDADAALTRMGTITYIDNEQTLALLTPGRL
ncbi:MAG: hypothetical protein P8Y44_05515, partial [Acidobacteriota bacterium]